MGNFHEASLGDNIELLIGNVLENPAKFSGKQFFQSSFFHFKFMVI